MAHTNNPSYSFRRQRSGGSQLEASLGKQYSSLYLKKPITQKRAGGVAHGVGPEFKPQYHQKKKKKKLKPQFTKFYGLILSVLKNY
jgi:hypothetical protein